MTAFPAARRTVASARPDPDARFRVVRADPAHAGSILDVAADDRTPRFVGGPDDAGAVRAALATLRVLVVGAGSVGSVAALHLARLGVGALGIVDPDLYDASNLRTQPIAPGDVGRPKAEVVARRASAVAPAARVGALTAGIEAASWADLARYDVICAATDNLTAELETGRRAAALGLPLFLGAVHGSTLTAQVRILGHAAPAPETPCVGCAYTESEWGTVGAHEVRYSCSGGSVRAERRVVPTMSVSPLSALAADLLVLEVLRWRLGLGASVTDRELEHNAYTHRTVETALRPNPACRCRHERFERVTVPGPLAAASLRACAAAAAVDPAGAGTVEVDGAALAARLLCATCGTLVPYGGFVRPGCTAGARCPGCDAPRELFVHPFHAWNVAPLAEAGAALDASLAGHGAAGARWVLLRSGGPAGERAVLVTGADGEADDGRDDGAPMKRMEETCA